MPTFIIFSQLFSHHSLYNEYSLIDFQTIQSSVFGAFMFLLNFMLHVLDVIDKHRLIHSKPIIAHLIINFLMSSSTAKSTGVLPCLFFMSTSALASSKVQMICVSVCWLSSLWSCLSLNIIHHCFMIGTTTGLNSIFNHIFAIFVIELLFLYKIHIKTQLHKFSKNKKIKADNIQMNRRLYSESKTLNTWRIFIASNLRWL